MLDSIASWPEYRFLRRQWVAWYSHLFKNFPQVVVIHTVKGFRVVNEAVVDVFLEFSGLFYDPMDVGNLISGSYAFEYLEVVSFLKPTFEAYFEAYFWSLVWSHTFEA